jgi:hypothetical protein
MRRLASVYLACLACSLPALSVEKEAPTSPIVITVDAVGIEQKIELTDSDTPVIWRCYSAPDFASLVFSLRHTSGEEFAWLVWPDLSAEFGMYGRNGVNMRFDWCNATTSPPHCFAVEFQPDGRASYVDFAFANEKGIAPAREHYYCESGSAP